MTWQLAGRDVWSTIRDWLPHRRGSELIWVSYTLRPPSFVLSEMMDRGIDVRLVARHPDDGVDFPRSAYEALETAGILSQARFYKAPTLTADGDDPEDDRPGRLHAKFVVARGSSPSHAQRLITGSFNLDPSSLRDCCESMLASTEVRATAQAWQDAENLWRRSEPVDESHITDASPVHGIQAGDLPLAFLDPPSEMRREAHRRPVVRPPPDPASYAPLSLRLLKRGIDHLQHDLCS